VGEPQPLTVVKSTTPSASAAVERYIPLLSTLIPYLFTQRPGCDHRSTSFYQCD
jgi:hypothetical protein